jgi:hypothetical protein
MSILVSSSAIFIFLLSCIAALAPAETYQSQRPKPGTGLRRGAGRGDRA